MDMGGFTVMRKAIILFLALFAAGCAFKGIESCVDGDIGNGCQPIANNLSAAVAKSESRSAGKLDIFDGSAAAEDDYAGIDTALIKDEYRRSASGNDTPAHLPADQVRIRIYPYSDGDRYYDTRDIYVLIRKAGWNKGVYVYNGSRNVSIAPDKPKETPKIAYITLDQLNVRAGASNQFTILAVVKQGQEIKILGERSGWYDAEIVREDKTIRGWVIAKYTSKDKPITKPPQQLRLGRGR
jgi:uncharacterized protein YgiM (DUF1202 family)